MKNVIPLCGVLVVAVAVLAPSAMAAPVQLDLSSGFNMDGLAGSADWTAMKATSSLYSDCFGREANGYAGITYTEHYPVVSNGDDITQGFAADGVVTTAYGTYHMAGNTGNATLAGNWADGKKNVIEFGNTLAGWHGASQTVTLPTAQQGKYSDVNFLMDTGSGWPYFYIQADYSDSTHQTIFTYQQNIAGGSLYGGTWNGPGVSGIGTVDPNHYRQALQVNQVGETWGGTNHVKYQWDWAYGPMGVWELATAAALDPDKTLVGFTFVDGTGDPTYTHVQYIWAASATPVPEPATLALLALGGLTLVRRKRAN